MNNIPKVASQKWMLTASVIAMLVGLLAVLVPAMLLPMKSYEATLFPIVRTAIEGLTPFTYIGLILGGAVLGWFFPKGPVWGILTMFPFYAAAILEMIVDPRSHKLWPIEFAIYFALSLLAVFGAFGATWVRRLVAHLRA
jgi:hypothetical protein